MTASRVLDLTDRLADSEACSPFYGIVGATSPMRRLFEEVRAFARAELPVLITGETGTGKELVARALHQLWRSRSSFVPVNCAALTDSLIESELFGSRKGAFTGASETRSGLVQQAQGGVLFLDEIGELSPPAQAKLLRLLEGGEYRRVGGTTVLRVDFRLIAATNRDLTSEVESGGFRLDLLHRLGAARIHLPPLRERAGDIPALASHLAARWQRERSDRPPRLRPCALAYIRSRPWPGNVRELRNVLEAALARFPHAEVTADLLREVAGDEDASGAGEEPTLDQVIEAARQAAAWNRIELYGGDRKGAAESLGISLSTLYRITRGEMSEQCQI